MTWADDPELLATFRVEVEDRADSLQAGLLQLEGHHDSRALVDGMFRDAHSIKGAARMLGVTPVLDVAHSAEDLLGALRDHRVDITTPVVDLLLAACDAVVGSLPGTPSYADPGRCSALAAALGDTATGHPAVLPPQPRRAEHIADWLDQTSTGSRAGGPATENPAAEDAAAESADAAAEGRPTVRLDEAGMTALSRSLGEAEVESYRLATALSEDRALRAVRADLIGRLGAALGDRSDADGPLADAWSALTAVLDQIDDSANRLRRLALATNSRLALTRAAAADLTMAPLRPILAGLATLVTDLTTGTDKHVVVEVEGGEVRVDHQVLDVVADALVHLVANAVDHGCEPAAVRQAQGKPAGATLAVSAYRTASRLVVEVSDDGAGIDEARVRAAAVARGLLPVGTTADGPALLRVLFEPAFTTTTAVTRSSGRGVGLDAVQAMVARVGGSVDIHSAPGAGTTVVLTVPVCIGVQRCRLVDVDGRRFAVASEDPADSVVDLVVVDGWGFPVPSGRGENSGLDTVVPMLDPALVPARPGAGPDAGTTDLGHPDRGTRDPATPEPAASDLAAEPAAHPVPSQPAADQPRTTRPARVLLVEDSDTVREIERGLLLRAGYDVEVAVDGAQGLARLAGAPVDLVVTDVEMPGASGIELVRAIRGHALWRVVPVIVMSSLISEDDRLTGYEAGADAYVGKPHHDRLLEESLCLVPPVVSVPSMAHPTTGSAMSSAPGWAPESRG